jgi:SAM-dependent methyltransferase
MEVTSPSVRAASPRDRCGATGYAFDNDSVHAREQHRCLAAMLDPITTERLAATGVGPGWHCLEVGAGGGSVSVWLAERVAPTGRVVATDIKPDHIPPAKGLKIAKLDLLHDPLPRAAFDLVVARLVLAQLPERRGILRRLVGALRPGGWLQIDEFDTTYGPALLMPDPAAHALYRRFMATKARLFKAAGADLAWGRHVAGAMRDAGLVAIDPAPHVELWGAGAPGVELLIHHTFHLRDRLLDAGMTDAALEAVRRLLRDPTFRATSYVLYSVHGRRPPVANA